LLSIQEEEIYQSSKITGRLLFTCSVVKVGEFKGKNKGNFFAETAYNFVLKKGLKKSLVSAQRQIYLCAVHWHN